MDGISINVRRGDGEIEAARFYVSGVPWIDMIFEFRQEICLQPGDSIKIKWDVPIVSSVGGEETGRYVEKWAYEVAVYERRMVTHARFTKRGDDAWIELLDGMPDDLYTASAQAERVA